MLLNTNESAHLRADGNKGILMMAILGITTPMRAVIFLNDIQEAIRLVFI